METCWVPALDSGSIDVFIQAMGDRRLAPVVPSSLTSSKAPPRACRRRQQPLASAATTRSSAGPTGSGPRVRSARSMSTKSAASSKPAPTRAAPPTPSAGNPAPAARCRRATAPARCPSPKIPVNREGAGTSSRFRPSKPPNRAKYLHHHNHLRANSRRQPQREFSPPNRELISQNREFIEIERASATWRHGSTKSTQ